MDSEKPRDLHTEIFGGKKDAVEAQSDRPIKDLINEAHDMVSKGRTYTILIKQGELIQCNGVPCTIARLKGQQLTVIPLAGYKLVKDTPANRLLINYIEPEEEKEKKEDDTHTEND